jgi:hypothetical protein
MLKAEIKPRTEYAVRKKRVVGGPLERVRIVAHVRGNKWKAEWIEPNPGLIHYVESGQLVSAWRDRKAWLKEGARGRTQASERSGGVQEGLAR